jgi:hypothetical protein
MMRPSLMGAQAELPASHRRRGDGQPSLPCASHRYQSAGLANLKEGQVRVCGGASRI